MCTISWFREAGGYHVFFNRDEQVGRAIAIPPRIIYGNKSDASCAVVMPIDPQGGGTWCAVNEFGLTFALLNFYQGRLPKGKLRSRGEIVKKLSSSRSFLDVRNYFQTQDFSRFAPFTLLCFVSGAADDSVPAFQWNGRELKSFAQHSPLFSSAVNLPEVSQVRKQIYEEYLDGINRLSTDERVSRFELIHQSHLPQKGAYSICMHRDIASTVSFSHIAVSESHIRYFYRAGHACSGESAPTQTLTRR